MKKKPKLIGLFTGAGGLDYGFEAAGFDCRLAIEFEKDCCATLRANRQWIILEKDIHEVSSRAAMKEANVSIGDTDIIIGGPPCQPFSKSAYWAKGDTLRLKDPRATTLDAYLRFIEDLLPTCFLLENVHGIKYSGKEEGFRLIESSIAKINKKKGTQYCLSWAVLNTADYGVPQIRTRFFLVAHREGRTFRFPARTHFPNHCDSFGQTCLSNMSQGYMTAWDAIGEMETHPDEDLRVRGRWADLLPSIPEGENYLWHTDRKGGLPLFGWRTRYWSFLLKLAKNRPSWTIQAQPGPAIGPFHWANRRLSIEEMARIQTFPGNLKYVGSRVSLQRQIGNAVPSLMAEILAREIAVQFFGATYSSAPLLTVKRKCPIPPPEKVLPVPNEFRNFACKLSA